MWATRRPTTAFFRDCCGMAEAVPYARQFVVGLSLGLKLLSHFGEVHVVPGVHQFAVPAGDEG
jgi:hypothetical protein